MNIQEVSTLLVRMKSVWPDMQVDDDITTAWSWALDNAELDAVTAAVKRLMKTSVFPPKPAEILSLVAESATGLPSHSAAWGMVLERMRGGMLASTWNEDVPAEVREAVKQIGGLYELRRSELPAADQKRFIEAYTALREQRVRDVQVNGAPPPFQPRSLGGPWTEVAPGLVTNHPEDIDTAHDYTLPARLLARSGD